jgi:hypothetical protein
MEDYIYPMIFNPSAFDFVRPKQTVVTTHPEVATTTTLANNVYVPPPRLCLRVDPTVATSSPGISHPFMHAFYDSETMTTLANDTYMRPPQSSTRAGFDQADLPPTSSCSLTFVIPDNSAVQSASFPVNSVASQIPGAIFDNSVVPLTLPRAPWTQSEPMSVLCHGAIPVNPRQKTNKPEAPHMTSKPDFILAGHLPLTSSFIPEPQPSFPPTSSFIPEIQTNFS